MANLKPILCLLLLATPTYSQFSSFIPAYAPHLPTQFVPVPNIYPLDSYVSFMPVSVSSTFGVEKATIISNNLKKSICKFPFVLLDGYCQCPRRLRYAFGKCLGATPEDYTDTVVDPNPPVDPSPPVDPADPNQPSFILCPVLKINNKNLTKGGIEDLSWINRNYNGTANNKKNTNWGSKGSLLERRVRANYEDNKSEPISFLPSARVISNAIGSQSNPIRKNRLNVTVLFTIFGQFVDHDIDLTPGSSDQSMDIEIPKNDKFFGNQDVINFRRSQFVEKPGLARSHPNVITSWLDGSQVYGSEDSTNCALRSFKNGKLKQIKGNLNQDLLPKQNGFFKAGDVRAIQNSILATIHTIFMREHNRVCDEILKDNPRFNDQTVFQIARNYVIGLLQKIVLKDFAKILLGDKYDEIIGPYDGYKSFINPNIPTEFSTACFRMGHALLPNSIPTINKKGKVLKQFRLNDLFFNQEILDQNFIENMMRGASQTLTKQRSPQLVDDIRNLLVLDPSKRQTKLDLFSLNIQRSRDHGLPFYNDAREAFGLPRIKNFANLLADGDSLVGNQLKKVYNTTDNLELFVGIISEKPINNGILGDLAAQIVGQTLRNLRDADRFWYQSAYPQSVIDQIDSTQLGDIIRRNCKNAEDIPSNVFVKQH